MQERRPRRVRIATAFDTRTAKLIQNDQPLRRSLILKFVTIFMDSARAGAESDRGAALDYGRIRAPDPFGIAVRANGNMSFVASRSVFLKPGGAAGDQNPCRGCVPRVDSARCRVVVRPDQ